VSIPRDVLRHLWPLLAATACLITLCTSVLAQNTGVQQVSICVVESDIKQNNRGVVVGLGEKSIELMGRIAVPMEVTFYGAADD
jgi:hypothetical protein